MKKILFDLSSNENEKNVIKRSWEIDKEKITNTNIKHLLIKKILGMTHGVYMVCERDMNRNAS